MILMEIWLFLCSSFVDSTHSGPAPYVSWKARLYRTAGCVFSTPQLLDSRGGIKELDLEFPSIHGEEEVQDWLGSSVSLLQAMPAPIKLQKASLFFPRFSWERDLVKGSCPLFQKVFLSPYFCHLFLLLLTKYLAERSREISFTQG